MAACSTPKQRRCWSGSICPMPSSRRSSTLCRVMAANASTTAICRCSSSARSTSACWSTRWWRRRARSRSWPTRWPARVPAPSTPTRSWSNLSWSAPSVPSCSARSRRSATRRSCLRASVARRPSVLPTSPCWTRHRACFGSRSATRPWARATSSSPWSTSLPIVSSRRSRRRPASCRSRTTSIPTSPRWSSASPRSASAFSGWLQQGAGRSTRRSSTTSTSSAA